MTATVAGWKTYATERGDTTLLPYPDATLLAALIRASDYIAYHYLNRAVSQPPEALIEAATYEAALFEIKTPGFFSTTFTPSQQKVLTAVGDIKWTVVSGATDTNDAFANALPTSTKVAAMFLPYVAGKNNYGVTSIG